MTVVLPVARHGLAAATSAINGKELDALQHSAEILKEGLASTHIG